MIGTTISHYKILEKLGEGGMGVVYKAQDITLDRSVALKFLPPHVASSSEDKARFIQEAKAAASLSHPNICTIFGVEEHDQAAFIVMELVEGKTLHDFKENIPFKQAVDIGIQLADGLAAAHEKGIVHRDIKPENIMIRKDGRVQIMDFGLAKLKGVSRLTKEGSTVGTAGYMSPEQVQGQDADHRSDIFSLGVVLYELMTGQLAFKGVHETAIAYEIVNVDAPPMSSIKPEIDPSLDAIILECLEKDPNERAQSAKQVSIDLKRFKRESSKSRVSRMTGTRPAVVLSPPQPVQQMEAGESESRLTRILPAVVRSNPWMIISLALTASSVALGYLYVQTLSIPPTVTRSSILAPETMSFNNEVGGHLAISPNGTTLAFVATDSVGKSQLWVRALSSLTALPLPGTGDAQYPFWSNDCKSVAFFSEGKLKRVDAAGGPVTTICDASSGRGGSWNQAGMIIFAPLSGGPIHQVAATGGASSPITKLDSVRKETSHRWPFFLPDGKHFLFTTQVGGGSVEGAIFGAIVGDSSRKKILDVSSNAEFANSSLTYVLQNNLIARPFDPGAMEFTGDPVPIAERIVFGEARSRSIFSFSRNGVLVCQSGSSRPPGLFSVDRNGKIQTQLNAGPVSYTASFSPDGKRIVLDRYDIASRNNDLWMYDIGRRINTRFTFDPGADIVPVFSPDGNTVVFSSDRRKTMDLFSKDLSGMNNEEFLYGSSLNDFATSFSPDGKFLLLSVNGDPKTKWDLLLLPLAGEKKPIPLAQTEFNEWVGVFSPDGKWVAYQSDESGKYEIYVRTLDPRGGRWQVSSSGGEDPTWLNKSSEIIYISSDKKVTSATVKYSTSSFEVLRTTPLFDLNIKGIGDLKAVSSDGQRFLVQLTGMEGASSPVTLVMNWQEELKKK